MSEIGTGDLIEGMPPPLPGQRQRSATLTKRDDFGADRVGGDNQR